MSMIPTGLRVAKYVLVLAPREALSLPPYMANTLRGGFGAAFKRLVCIYRPPQPCEVCDLRHICPYGALFEAAVPPGSEVLRRNTDIPRPFVLEPPLDGRTQYGPNDALKVGLVLVGRAIHHLPYFLVAFQELGRAGLGVRRGKFTIREVRAVNPLTGEEVAVLDSRMQVLAGRDMSVGAAELEAAVSKMAPRDEVVLRFITPTRLVHDGRLVMDPEFPILLRALLRRISSLAYFHCGERWALDFRRLKEDAGEVKLVRSNLRWWDWQRYSARQQTQVKLGGFLGDAVYRGPLTPFLPLLLLGSIIHVGKACTFGHGRYDLI
jgi:DNA-binding transcriptional regulator of glucitol operon